MSRPITTLPNSIAKKVITQRAQSSRVPAQRCFISAISISPVTATKMMAARLGVGRMADEPFRVVKTIQTKAAVTTPDNVLIAPDAALTAVRDSAPPTTYEPKRAEKNLRSHGRKGLFRVKSHSDFVVHILLRPKLTPCPKSVQSLSRRVQRFRAIPRSS